MITKLQLLNFKCFEKQPITLGAINVFAGSNGTGKSTVIQSILLLFQSYQTGDVRFSRLRLNGPLVELGTGKDVLYKRSESDVFEIGVETEVGSSTFKAAVRSDSHARLIPSSSTDSSERFAAFRNRLFYLSADRLGPQLLYTANHGGRGNAIGRRGEFAPLLYQRYRAAKLRISNESLLLRGSDDSQSNIFEAQFELWMGRLFPGFDLRADLEDRIDSVILGMSLNTQVGEPEFLRPSNIAFGVSVAFPIILAGLASKKFTTLVVENPEAHLHASAQSLVGEFLARVAAGGVQVFIETHSEHVVNGIRLAIKNELISKDRAKFFAFSRTVEFGSNQIQPVVLGEAGDFQKQPEFFFDQSDKDLRLLYGF
jgi:predicted ATPase